MPSATGKAKPDNNYFLILMILLFRLRLGLCKIYFMWNKINEEQNGLCSLPLRLYYFTTFYGETAHRYHPSSDSSVRTRARIAEWGTIRYFFSSNSISID
jgi:hypothetical protein